MRWIIRFIGLISTVIVARILSPEDYGVVAMAMITVGILQVFSDMGIDLSLVRHPDPKREHYDTAWTFQFSVGCIIALLILLSAPLTSHFFDDDRVKEVMLILAVVPIFTGLSNIGVVDFRRNLNFKKEFQFNTIIKLVSAPMTIGLAIILQNYYALVFGMVASALAALVVSYLMHAYRPRFSMKTFDELWSFSLWILVRNLAVFLRTKVDQIVIGRIAGSDALGSYHLASELARSFTLEIAHPIGRALLPGYARVQQDPVRIQSAYGKALGGLSLIMLPVAAGLASISDIFIPLLLGDQWQETSKVFPILALAFAASSLTIAAAPMMVAMKKVKTIAIIRVLQLFILSLILFTLVLLEEPGLLGVATVIAAVEWAFLPVFLIAACRAIGLPALMWLGIVVRPLLASLGMLLVLLFVGAADFDEPLLDMTVKILVGIPAYLLFLILLWNLWGRPPGAERLAIDYAWGKIGSQGLSR